MLTEENLRKVLVDRGLLTPDQLQECLREQSDDLAQGRTHRLLSSIAVAKGFVRPEELQQVLDGKRPASLAVDVKLPPDVAEAMKNEGNLFGKYVRIAVLGRGGMGIVFKAWDSDLKRYVALKFLEGATTDEIRRFQREAQLAASLKHKNIAQIYEMGTIAERYYIAMELIRGVTLERYIGKITEKQLLNVMRQLSEAVGYAHSKGIVHRDVKPQNIMLEQPLDEKAPIPENLQVYVMDFGLAKNMQMDSSLSMSGIVMGTPQYMSPEQATGDPKALDHRSDIYSIGATMYHMLCGRPSSVGETPMQIVMNLATVDPEPLRSLKPELSRDVEVMVHKCLEKDRDRRYLSAQALQKDIELFLSGQPIEAQSPSLIHVFGKGIRKHRALLFVAVTLGVALLLGGGMMLRSQMQAQVAIDKAKKDKEEADRRFRAGSALIELPQKSISKEARRERKKSLDDAVKELTAAIQLDPKNPSYYTARAQAYILQSRQNLAVADYTAALKLDAKLGDALWGRTICRFLQMGEGFDIALDLKPDTTELMVTPFSRNFDRQAVTADLESLKKLGKLYASKVKCIEGVLLFYDRKLPDAVSKFGDALKEELFSEAYALRGYTVLVRLQQEMGGRTPDTVRTMSTDLTKAIEADPNIPIYYVLRCVAHSSIDFDFKLALEDIDQALEINPDDADLYVVKAYVCVLTSDIKQAWTLVETAREKDPENPRVDMMASFLHWVGGDKAEAIKLLDGSLKKNSQYPSLYYLRGLYELATKDNESADRDFASYLNQLTKEQRPTAEEFIARLKKNDIGKRLEDLGNPKSPKDLLEDANRARDAGSLDEALRLYRQVVMRSGGRLKRSKDHDKESEALTVEAQLNIVKILLQRKEFQMAFKSFEMMVRMGFNDFERMKKDPVLRKFLEDPKVQEAIKKGPGKRGEK